MMQGTVAAGGISKDRSSVSGCNPRGERTKICRKGGKEDEVDIGESGKEWRTAVPQEKGVPDQKGTKEEKEERFTRLKKNEKTTIFRRTEKKQRMISAAGGFDPWA